MFVTFFWFFWLCWRLKFQKLQRKVASAHIWKDVCSGLYCNIPKQLLQYMLLSWYYSPLIHYFFTRLFFAWREVKFNKSDRKSSLVDTPLCGLVWGWQRNRKAGDFIWRNCHLRGWVGVVRVEVIMLVQQ